MKHLSTTCVLMFFVLAACQKSNVAPALEKKPMTSRALQGIASNSATPFNSSFDINLGDPGLSQFNSCTVDVLQITGGILHVDLHGTTNGNKISVAQHINTENFKMIDLTTGAVYAGSSSSDLVENFALAGSSVTITQTQSILLTTAGGKNNSIVKFDVHETFNAQGVLTVFTDNFRSGCK